MTSCEVLEMSRQIQGTAIRAGMPWQMLTASQGDQCIREIRNVWGLAQNDQEHSTQTAGDLPAPNRKDQYIADQTPDGEPGQCNNAPGIKDSVCYKVGLLFCNDEWISNKDDVYFISTRENLAKRIKNLSRKSLVSKFPGMYQTCSNQTFAREMSLALKLLPAATSSNAKLWPETFVLPDDMKDVKEAMVRAQAE